MKSSGWSCASWDRRPCSPRAFAKPPAARLLLPRRRPGARAPLWQLRKRAVGPARGRGAVRIVPDHSRDLSRVPARHLRPAGADRHPAARPQPLAARRQCRIAEAVAVLGVAAVRLRRQLHLRRRCAAGRAPRTGAVGRSVAAARPDRRHRAARSARRIGARHARAGAAAPAARVFMRARPMPFTICCCASATCHATEIEARSEAGVADPAIDELVRTAPRLQRPHRRRAALHCRRGCGALSRRDRRAAAAGPAGRRCSSRSPIPSAIWCAASAARMVRSRARTSAQRLGLGVAVVEAALARLLASGRVVDGEFRPGGRGREWCDAEVLRTVRQRSLARLRQEVEPVESTALGRFLVGWHSLGATEAADSTACST